MKQWLKGEKVKGTGMSKHCDRQVAIANHVQSRCGMFSNGYKVETRLLKERAEIFVTAVDEWRMNNTRTSGWRMNNTRMSSCAHSTVTTDSKRHLLLLLGSSKLASICLRAYSSFLLGSLHTQAYITLSLQIAHVPLFLSRSR